MADDDHDRGSTRTADTPARRAVAEHLRLLGAGDLDRWIELFAPDCVFAFPFAPPGMTTQVRGRPALLEHMRAFPATFEVRAVDLRFIGTDDPRVAVAEFGLSGTALPTGRPYEQTCIVVVRLDETGLVARLDDYWNPLAAMQALQPDGTTDAADAPDASGVARSFGAPVGG